MASLIKLPVQTLRALQLQPVKARALRGLQTAPGRRNGHVLQAQVEHVEAKDTAEGQQIRGEGRDIVATARQKSRSNLTPVPEKQLGPLSEFAMKMRAAWEIFFPRSAPPVTPKEAGKQRLRMILVADRCGMNPTVLTEMKVSIVNVVSEYVDIEAEELVEVNMTQDPDMGTIYSVAVPVRRVKPQARVTWGGDAALAEGITMEWDQEDFDSDPSSRFPFGC